LGNFDGTLNKGEVAILCFFRAEIALCNSVTSGELQYNVNHQPSTKRCPF